MNIKKTFRALFLSNVVLSGIIFASLPATAASANLKNISNNSQSVRDTTISDLTVVRVNRKFVQEAYQYIDSALQFESETAETKDTTEAPEPFEFAIANFEKAANSLKKAGMHDTAKNMENCIKALNDALEATSTEEEDKLIEKAVEYLNQVRTDIQKVMS